MIWLDIMRVPVLTLSILAASSAAQAQERQFGAKAGPSFAVVAFEPRTGESYDRRIGADGGGFLVLPLAERLALQIEALFNSRGAKLYDADLDLTGSVLLQYFDIPVLVRIDGPRRGSRAFHVFGGPYAGTRLSATRQVSEFAGGITAGEKLDMSREVERFELGVIGGVGVEIGPRIVVDGRYVRALTALNTDKSDGLRIRNRAISFMLGVRF